MLFRDYERPDGWSRGLPEVLLSAETIDTLGMPEVDYEGVNDFIRPITGGKLPNIVFEQIDPTGDTLGFVRFLSRTIRVDAVATETLLWHSYGVVRVIAHEAQHYGDFTNRRLCSFAEIALGHTRYVHHMLTLRFTQGIVIPKQREDFSRLERRAYEIEETDTVAQHAQDILFPYSRRTTDLLQQNESRREQSVTRV